MFFFRFCFVFTKINRNFAMYLKRNKMEKWFNIYITDKTGKEIFKNICSGSSVNGILKELNQHLKFIKEKNKLYKNINIDPDTAVIIQKEQ